MIRARNFLRRGAGPRTGWRPLAVLVGATLLALGSSITCDDPQSPAPGPASDGANYHGSYDAGGGVLAFRLETSNGGEAPLRLLASDIHFDAATQELHAQVAIRNIGLETLRGPRGILIGSLDPTSVWPTNAEPLPCPECVTCPCPFPFLFVHSGTYGDDGMLSPGETSTPVEWIFNDPSGESFSFRALPQSEFGPAPGTISGMVFVDDNADGHRQDFEVGIPGATVALLHGDTKEVATTDGAGRFVFQIAEDGLYEVVRAAEDACVPTTPLRLQVLVVRRPDGSLSGYAGADFGCRGAEIGVVSVQGIVYEDLNRDGQYQTGEPGLPDVLVDGATPQCPTFAAIQARTDEKGMYRMQLPVCMPPYVFTREPLPGFVDTSPNPVVVRWGMPGPTRVPGSPPNDVPFPALTVNFGAARIDSTLESSVEGVVFEDTNHNGIREDDERGLPGVQVTAGGVLCMSPVIGLTYTDPVGRYFLRQSDVHCTLPWSVGHEPLAGMCDTSTNPVVVGMDRRPDPRHYRVDFGVAPCDSLATPFGSLEGAVRGSEASFIVIPPPRPSSGIRRTGS